MFLLILGAEGTGHHAIAELLRSSQSAVKFSIHKDLSRQVVTANDQLMQESDAILSRHATLFEGLVRKLGRVLGVSQLSVSFSRPPSGRGASPGELRFIYSEIIRKAADEMGYEVVDASIPFRTGINRSEFRHLDYFILSEILKPTNTRIISLTRDPKRMSSSVFRRGHEPTPLLACYSVEHSLIVQRHAENLFSKFPRLKISFDSLVCEPAIACAQLERFLGLEKGSLDPALIYNPESSQATDIENVFIDFWTANRAAVIGSQDN